MPAKSDVPQPVDEPGIAHAEDGLVILDGPGGIALTLTPGAAGETGRNLIGASKIAEQQAAEKDRA
jgi:hypothetical protein